jgi:5-methylcytosine-specific restriction endonuclease McrA
MAIDVNHQTSPSPISEFDCPHSSTRICRKRQSNGVLIYVRQCLTCGRNQGNIAKASYEVRMLAEIPEWDQAIVDRWEARRTAFYEERRREWKARTPGTAEWWQQYNAYLESAIWRHKRSLVLERDSYVCQGCMQSRATQVHHLTYAHVGNELLFELVAVCDARHHALHPEMD